MPPSSCRSPASSSSRTSRTARRSSSRRPNGARVIHLVSSRSQPVNLQAATPAIEAYLLNERKRKLVADDLRSLRGAAKIEYVGEYAANKPPPLPMPPADDKPVTSIAPPPASGVDAAPQIDVAPREAAPASMPSSDDTRQGSQGDEIGPVRRRPVGDGTMALPGSAVDWSSPPGSIHIEDHMRYFLKFALLFWLAVPLALAQAPKADTARTETVLGLGRRRPGHRLPEPRPRGRGAHLRGRADQLPADRRGHGRRAHRSRRRRSASRRCCARAGSSSGRRSRSRSCGP